MNEQTCENCKYWKRIKNTECLGLCKSKPKNKLIQGGFPKSIEYSWCKKYKVPQNKN